ncbi:MAG: hypothetical protein QOJ44_656 [Acidimicrobiaceae bacterium]|nr:hypothetical protein [Acidimicrobiaceae bacterium]
MGAIHQFVPMLHRHDAVGEHTMALRDLLHRQGVPSKIYSQIPDPHTAEETTPYLEYEAEAEPGDVLVYQFATESAMAGWLLKRVEPLVVNYHSVTPPEFFAPWNLGITQIQAACLHELDLIAPAATLGIAVSEFDRAELIAAGCPSTVVIPVLTAARPLPPADLAFRRWIESRSGSTTWLSVGRLVPNKSHHLAIAALFAYRMSTDPSATMVVVGSPAEPHYAVALRHYAAQLGLHDAVSFLSGISEAELAACYDAADVLVMLSAHEGFGVPLVEAMRQGLPVVAHDGGAVAEVLGDVGVLLSGTEPLQVAAAVRAVLSDPEGRKQALAGSDDQLRHLGIESAGKRLVEALQGVPETAGPAR